MRLGGSARRFRAAALAAAVAAVLGGASLQAAGAAPIGQVGYDISFPQCGGPYPTQPYQFGVVGLNGGRPNTLNPCYGAEYAWAEGGLGGTAAVYVNSSWGQSDAGPRRCTRTDDACRAYNYGYEAAHYDLDHAGVNGAHPVAWWLDVETANRWSPDTRQNAAALQGMVDALRTDPAITTLGAYSTSYQWKKIAGSFRPGLPSWVAGALAPFTAPLSCSSDNAFAGDTVAMVQYPGGQYDGDYAC